MMQLTQQRATGAMCVCMREVNCNKWRLLRSWYTKPKCRVKVNGRLSDELEMERGVLQGSGYLLLYSCSLSILCSRNWKLTPSVRRLMICMLALMISGLWLPAKLLSTSRFIWLRILPQETSCPLMQTRVRWSSSPQ